MIYTFECPKCQKQYEQKMTLAQFERIKRSAYCGTCFEENPNTPCMRVVIHPTTFKAFGPARSAMMMRELARGSEQRTG